MGTIVQEKTHATLGPSGAHRWVPCPGSIVLSAGRGDAVGRDAKWGTAAHELAAILLEPYSGLQLTPKAIAEIAALDAEAYLGRVFTVEGDDFEVDGDMATCVNDYIGQAVAYMEMGDRLCVEREVSIQHITGEVGATGTSDLIVIKPAAKEIIVIDLKTGRGVIVWADDNEQCTMYGEGARNELDFLYGPFENLTNVIIQPRVEHVSEERIDIATLAQRVEMIREASRRVDIARLERGTGLTRRDWIDDFLNPGTKQCKFCPAKGIPCPALSDAVSGALSFTAPAAKAEDFPDLSLPKQAAAAVVDMAAIEDETFATACRALEMVEAWVDAVRDERKRRLFDGKPVSGFYLGLGPKGSREWEDPKAAEETMRKAKLTVDEMFTKKLITFPAAEKKFKGNKTLWAKLAPNVKQAPAGPIVCKDGDGKPVWTSAAPADAFPELETDPFS